MKPLTRFVELAATAPIEQLRLSPVLAETVAETCRDQDQPVVLVRHQPTYILLGPKDRRLPYFNDAIAWLRSRRYPVFMRVGGGSAVLLDQDCLSFAVARPCRDFTVWETNFREMAQGVILGLSRLGVTSEFGRAAGSYCEGPFDLVCGGQKIAGIAQAIRAGYALVSGMILVRQDPETTTALLQEFYRRAGSSLVLQPSAVTSLDRLPGLASITVKDVAAAITSGFAELYRLQSHPLSRAEWQRAHQLYGLRQIIINPEEDLHASHHSHG